MNYVHQIRPRETVKPVGTRAKRHDQKEYFVLFGIDRRSREAVSVEYERQYPEADWTASEAEAHHESLRVEETGSNIKVNAAVKILRRYLH